MDGKEERIKIKPRRTMMHLWAISLSLIYHLFLFITDEGRGKKGNSKEGTEKKKEKKKGKREKMKKERKK